MEFESELVQLYSAENDPQTRNGPQIIPDVDRKWSRRKTRKGMEFVPWVVDSDKQKQVVTDPVLYGYTEFLW